MSNFNYCERAGEVDPEEFIGLLVKETVSLKASETFGSGNFLVALNGEIAVDPVSESDAVQVSDVAKNCAQRLVADECELYSLVWLQDSPVEDGDFSFNFFIEPKEAI